MKKTTLMILGWIYSTSFSFAQMPYTTPDNIGTGNCFSFDGSNDYVNCGTGTLLQPNTATLTLEAWVYRNNVTGFRYIAGKRKTDQSNNTSKFQILINTSGNPYCEVRGSKNKNVFLTGSTTIPHSEWHHVALVVNNTSPYVTLYLDGVVDAQSTTDPGTIDTGGGASGNYFSIGRHTYIIGGPTQYFDGKIDEVRFWNVALTQAQIRNNMTRQLTGSETGIVGYWNMNEGTDGTCTGGEDVCDITGNGNHGLKQ